MAWQKLLIPLSRINRNTFIGNVETAAQREEKSSCDVKVVGLIPCHCVCVPLGNYKLPADLCIGGMSVFASKSFLDLTVVLASEKFHLYFVLSAKIN